MEHVEIWKNCLEVIKDNISPQAFKTWFTPIVPIRLKKNVLTIQVPTYFFYEWLEGHYIDIIHRTLIQEIGKDARLEYSIVMQNNQTTPLTINLPTNKSNVTKNPSVQMPLDLNSGNNREIPNPFIIPGLKKIEINSQLNGSFSFDNFIEGDCNRLARSAGYAVACNPGKSGFNPLFIYSQTGLGKTHLVQAIGLKAKELFPEKIVLYVGIEQFMQQFYDSVKNNNQNDFIHFYQMIDVLIIDDIEFLSGKEKTQDVFFHIFDFLHQKNKQIIITSDKSPVDLVGFEQRLLSRFKWGLAADLQIPDVETRIAILNQLAYKDGITLPNEIIEYIAYRVTNNVRELEGALRQIIAQTTLNKKEVTIELTKNIIDKFIKNTEKEISIDLVKKSVFDYFDLPVEIINNKSRKRNIVQARQLAMYFAKKYTQYSLAVIGKHCGNKDHATVLHACKTVKNLIETDKQFKVYVEEIDKKIKF
ncbi:MAG: chromosomal replication initiator protein DnaA [Lentimicrobiaceae bacterium]|nr:chromosomal replication initiator protein DnaA [Lentimicrobiaceae bacterium]